MSWITCKISVRFPQTCQPYPGSAKDFRISWRIWSFLYLIRYPFKIQTFLEKFFQYLLVGFIDYSRIQRWQINHGRSFGIMSHAFADDRQRNTFMFCHTGPWMARYIEYKNKTQEKCNYCTIYQCISGFYKKNVELHLLLILAIDSVIYSFYVTILLCKKAPVFD